MARPIKKGLDYFPMDVDFTRDIKVRRIINACGKESVYILHVLLASVYREEGYYLTWNDDIAFLVADEVGTKEGTVNELINKAVQVGFFNKDLYDRFKILTSKGIQNRYIIATGERKKVELESEYLLTNEVNRSNISVIHGVNEVNHGHSTQSKEKESKVKKRKKDNSPSADELERDFELLWELYPKKTGKKDALRHYKNAIKVGTTNKEIQDGIINYIKFIEINNTDEQYIKGGSTYFFKEAWTDVLDLKPRVKSFGNNHARKETLPDWASQENQIYEETPLSAEEEAEIKAKIERLSQPKQQAGG